MNSSQYQNPTSKKSTLKIVIVVLALFLVAGMVYGSWKVLGSKKGQSQSEATPVSVVEEPTESVAPKSSGESKSEPTAGWQGNSNLRVGYSIQYPKDFELSTREESFYKEATTLKLPADKWETLFIYVDAEKYPTEVTAREWADLYYPVTGSSGYTDIVIGDMQGIKIDFSDTNGTFGEVILARKNTVVKVRYSTEEVQKRDEVLNLVNQIINTLQLN